MSSLNKAFLTEYLSSLGERTRAETRGMQWGIDWVVYNLGLSLYGKPVRLPFMRQPGSNLAQSKTEAEFGTDLAFLSSDGKELVVFVLKDERLTNSTWTGNGFDTDLKKATYPDLTNQDLRDVTAVKIILAYNQDEDANGIELYDRLVQGQPTKLKDSISLSFERWNLSTLVDQTLKHLLSTTLVPQSFFAELTYLCAIFADVRHGSEAWEIQFIPGWKRFLDQVLQQGTKTRGATLVPVALIILKEHGKANASIETAWIELVEWAALALWRKAGEEKGSGIQKVAVHFWHNFYLSEIHRFYSAHIGVLGTPHAIDQAAIGSYAGTVAVSGIAHWHLGRLGLLSYALTEKTTAQNQAQSAAELTALKEVSDWLIQIINANQATKRPVLDIQHLEWGLVLLAFVHARRLDQAVILVQELVEYLFYRRFGLVAVPFLVGSASLYHVMSEAGASREEQRQDTGSSYFILMLLEWCCAFPGDEGDRLLQTIHRRLVLGAFDDGSKSSHQPLNLLSWIAPSDWPIKVLSGRANEGEIVTLGPFVANPLASAADIRKGIVQLVCEMRKVSSFPTTHPVPLSVLLLASLRHKSPMPPELWRRFVFPEAMDASAAN